MRELYFDPEWKFNDIVRNIRTLRSDYEGILASFYYFDIKEVVHFKKQTRDMFYSYPFEEWRKDRLWEYMNGFIPFYDLICIMRR